MKSWQSVCYCFLIGILSLLTWGLGVHEVRAEGKVHLVVSVDWEGRILTPSNLGAMQEFRREFPDLNLLQFLNAAYFTKSGADPSDVKQKISAVLKPGDELGLHIHGWKSLFEAAGVTYQDSPTYWGGSPSATHGDRGHEVPATAYTREEFRKVIHFSIKTLQHHGLGRATSFRTGGWLGSNTVLHALVEEGITLDSSAVPPAFLKNLIGDSPLFRWVSVLWGFVKPDSQPWKIETPAGKIWELPDNGALADYVQTDEMVQTFQSGVKVWKETGKDVFVHIGFHQETASTYLPRVIKALREIKNQVDAMGIPFEYAKFPLIKTLEKDSHEEDSRR